MASRATPALYESRRSKLESGIWRLSELVNIESSLLYPSFWDNLFKNLRSSFTVQYKAFRYQGYRILAFTAKTCHTHHHVTCCSQTTRYSTVQYCTSTSHRSRMTVLIVQSTQFHVLLLFCYLSSVTVLFSVPFFQTDTEFTNEEHIQ